VALAYRTPARGVVLTPLTNFAIRDRAAGTVMLNSSVGMWHKLARLREDPHVAVAFHTREHSLSERREYVLVQGRASLSDLDQPDAWLESIGEGWERFGGQPRDVGRLWARWLRAYHWRVNIEIAVARVIAWPDLACEGAPMVYGASLPADQSRPQPPPTGGVTPRVDHARAARRAASLPSVLIGWVGADEFPVVVPVTIAGTGELGIALQAPPRLLASGGRRAGLLAHRFSRHVVGQRQRKHTGWLDVGTGAGAEILYAPHTAHHYTLPASRLAYNLGAGFVSRRGLREARRAGFVR
jgi:hypothetical protein